MCWLLPYMSQCLCVNSDLFYAKVIHVRDIFNIKLKVSFYNYLNCRLANIYLPPDMNNASIKNACSDMKTYLYNKTFQVRLSDDNSVHLYNDHNYVNNIINNMILNHYIHKNKNCFNVLTQTR